ncbi:GNAT family N-acetyltransferase [Ketogulonicigenium vulgare]|uniref:Acetyltransferase, GNAT family protein n=1 Tax=Ketogulonicigenium vulgare (strain WSH-001) TaxID=759362 RepID=F9Y869_KETVW|nr:N-acetyltransferase [Ketogulonicigenium vulgare]AEM42355.1 Acetyltransferase, GNAT family protein [Ketogulonicigenium vulgare WSH-001]ALJ79980.1 acetyltransferase [Ketogulonicigenium vulgare]ANW32870.1 acetyltransferase [Ketogulonicigenium vulgare]AOZ53439.1 Acetyltransferase, GNAT family protein [Ketogulonicigenium vulgare]
MFTIAQETPDDWWEVESLYDLCFAPGREALSSYRLRDDVPPIAGLSLVARGTDGSIAGAIRHWPVRICTEDGICNRSLLLGPVAVHPTHQGEGLGGLLIYQTLGGARALGWERVMLVGDAPYYNRFGFQKLEGVLMPPPTNPDRVLGVALKPNAWAGVRGQVSRWSPDMALPQN